MEVRAGVEAGWRRGVRLWWPVDDGGSGRSPMAADGFAHGPGDLGESAGAREACARGDTRDRVK